MEDNPYSGFVKVIKKAAEEQIPEIYRFGKVVSTFPLKVETSGTIQAAADLLINSAVTGLM